MTDKTTAAPATATDDPQNKVATRVRRIAPISAAPTDRKTVQVAGKMVLDGQDVGDFTGTLSGPAADLVEVGATYTWVKGAQPVVE